MLRQQREKQQMMNLVIMEQMVPEDHLLRKVDRAVDFSFIYELCAPLYCADNGRPAIDPEILFRMLLVGYLYGIKSEARLEEEINYNIAYKWFCGLELTEKAPDATTISQNRRRRFRDNNIAEQIFNEILRQCITKGLVGGAILYTDSTHIKAKANKHKKKQVVVEQTPKSYLKELDEQVDLDRKVLGKKPFDRDDDHKDGGSGGGGNAETATRMQSTTDPDSGQQSREGKPDGFHYSEHRTVDSAHNVIVNVHVEPANINDVTPMPEILNEIESRLGKLPKYMGLDAGYHNAWIAHLLKTKGIQGVIGYRRHTHKGEHYGKYRFRYDPFFDAYICPEHQHLYWKTTTREGYRQYFCDAKICAACPRRNECFGKSMTRRMVERHVWQDALDDVITFTKTHNGSRIYSWRKQTIERSFAEAKVNHGLRYARMLGIKNMREQCFLTAAVQNIKRLVASLFFLIKDINPRTLYWMRGLSMV
ncbi:MAG: IS1182 family transposase [Clostridia bacterium]|nr:IS1182 family transposase [Clostridia bacterium]